VSLVHGLRDPAEVGSPACGGIVTVIYCVMNHRAGLIGRRMGHGIVSKVSLSEGPEFPWLGGRLALFGPAGVRSALALNAAVTTNIENGRAVADSAVSICSKTDAPLS
jgi:hypothetical protein